METIGALIALGLAFAVAELEAIRKRLDTLIALQRGKPEDPPPLVPTDTYVPHAPRERRSFHS